VLPLRVVVDEVLERGFGDFESGAGLDHGGYASDFVRMTFGLTIDVGPDVCAGFLDITGDVEGVARGFGDGETVVEGDAAGNSTETAGGCQIMSIRC